MIRLGKDDRYSLTNALLLTALFGLINALLRRAKGEWLAMDDAKTNVFTQTWQWGYQPDNPPLFEWLTILLHPLTGGGLWSFLVIKYVAMTAAVGFIYSAVRQYSPQRTAFAVSTGLVLLYQIGWNFHEAFTHSALLVAGVSATIWAGLRVVDRPGLKSLLIFGAASGVAVMTKYNAALFVFPFVAAVLSFKESRHAFARPGAMGAILVKLLIILPHLLWFIHQTEAYTDTLSGTLGTTGGYADRVVDGIVSLIVSTLTFFLPFGFVALWLVRLGSPERLLQERVLIRTSAISLAVLGMAVVAFGIGNVSERYLLPVLLPAYVGFASALLRRADEAARPWFIASGATVAVVLAVRIAGVIAPGEPFCSRCLEFVPYDPLVEKIEEVVPEGAILVVREENTGGNLVKAFPLSPVRVFTSLFLTNPIKDEGRPCYLIWSEDMVWGVPLEQAFTYAYDDPETVMVRAPWPDRVNGRMSQTRWGITPLRDNLYTTFCTSAG